MKAKAWYILFPNDTYAMGPIRFEDPLIYPKLKNGQENGQELQNYLEAFHVGRLAIND